jgi:hypothetical protein
MQGSGRILILISDTREEADNGSAIINKYNSFISGRKDLVSKADKSQQVYKRAFTDYTSQLYLLKNLKQVQ